MITINDYQRLNGLLSFSTVKDSMSELKTQLDTILGSAEKLPQENISQNIITMNSKVLLKDQTTDREAVLTVTYPQDANSRERKISVLSQIGIALLGKHVGDVVSWKIPAGYGQFEIVKIVYQPEAVGDYYL